MKPQHPNLSNPIDRSLFVPIPGPKLFPLKQTTICASFVRGRARAASIRREQKAKGKSYFFSLNYLLTTGWLLTTGHEAFLPCNFCRLPPPPLPRDDWLDGTFMTYKFPRFCCGSLPNIAGICCPLRKEEIETKQNRFALERGARRVSRNYDVFELLLKTTFRE